MIANGCFCVLFIPEALSFKRAKVYNFNKNTNIVCVYLIDSGQYYETAPDKLFNLLEPYYNVEPLCFECTFDIQCDKDIENILNDRFNELGNQI